MIGWAIGLPALRVGLVLVVNLITWALLRAAGQPVGFPVVALSALLLFPVNVASLMLLRRRLHREGRRLRDLVGLSRGRLPRDLLWGLLWFVVLQAGFGAALFAVMAIRYGSDMTTAFATIFVDTATAVAWPPWLMITLFVITVITFAPLNAPAEELIYRGYAQTELATRLPTWLAIGIPAALFALQHLFFAPTAAAMPVFGIAFAVWAVGAGLILHRQRRLVPLIFAHLLVNLVTTVPTLLVVLMFSQGS
ncbi:CPBP family intramembrane glutamic endopeptidase [Microlunatus sp. GCM10028923]|uniref:CPBP family intramembrane glutamic endopeptidase n=1 Tax=Microlunatus sp. GCM10028923 TaxID=3273400 RepID=UPI00362097E0